MHNFLHLWFEFDKKIFFSINYAKACQFCVQHCLKVRAHIVENKTVKRKESKFHDTLLFRTLFNAVKDSPGDVAISRCIKCVDILNHFNAIKQVL